MVAPSALFGPYTSTWPLLDPGSASSSQRLAERPSKRPTALYEPTVLGLAWVSSKRSCDEETATSASRVSAPEGEMRDSRCPSSSKKSRHPSQSISAENNTAPAATCASALINGEKRRDLLA